MFAYCLNNPILFADPEGTNPYASYIAYKTCAEQFGGGSVYIVVGLGVAAAAATPSFIDALSNTLDDINEWIDEQKQAIVDKLEASLTSAKQREYKTEYEIHHITARKSSNAAAAAAILNRVLPGGVEDPLNKVPVKTSVHRRIHTNEYYALANYLVISAYQQANGDPSQQYSNVVTVLGGLRIFIIGLNALSIN